MTWHGDHTPKPKSKVQHLAVPESARVGEDLWLCQTCPRCRWSVVWTPYVVKGTKDRVFLTRKHLYYDPVSGQAMAPIHNLECEHPQRKYWDRSHGKQSDLMLEERYAE